MERKHLGTFAADAGLVVIGAPEALRDDPTIGQTNPLTNWDEVCRPFADGVRCHMLGVSGLVYQAGGDGLFTVLTEHDETGRPVRLVIELP
jgi:hypothetical protein